MVSPNAASSGQRGLLSALFDFCLCGEIRFKFYPLLHLLKLYTLRCLVVNDVKLPQQDGEIELNIENEKVKTTPELHTKSGIGIDNTRMRLDLLYPKKYALLIDNGINYYRVKLKLVLI